MINSLVIAPTFLQSSDACAQIERHLFSNLTYNNFFVICSDARSDLELQQSNILIYKTSEKRIINKLDLLFRKLLIKDLYLNPDSYHYSWSSGAYDTACDVLNNNDIDYILSISNPVSVHLLAYKLKLKSNKPWVAYFMDPWHNNPFRDYKYDYFRNKDRRNESIVAEFADLILFPNNELMDAWIEKYGDLVRHKVAILPFVTFIPQIKDHKDKEDKITISHIGTLSEERRAKVFLEALAKLRDVSPQKLKKIKVNIVGHITDSDKKIIEQEGLDDVVNVVGRVSEQACTAYYEKSDLFLIVDIDCSPNLFYPSKLLKYFCYQKPIIGITKEHSVVANELKKTGNYVLGYNDVQGICELLSNAVDNYQSLCNNDVNYYKRFMIASVSDRFHEILKTYIL